MFHITSHGLIARQKFAKYLDPSKAQVATKVATHPDGGKVELDQIMLGRVRQIRMASSH
jgi:uncharacterized protein YwbE